MSTTETLKEGKPETGGMVLISRLLDPDSVAVLAVCREKVGEREIWRESVCGGHMEAVCAILVVHSWSW